jgi:glutaminyl-peptide cyclotransferase
MHKRLLAVTVLLLAAWRCPGDVSSGVLIPEDVKAVATGFSVDAPEFMADSNYIASSPHPMGSTRQSEVATYLRRRIEESGARAEMQEFQAEVPNPAALSGPAPLTRVVTGRNVYAWPGRFEGGADAGKKCLVLIASHYDTKNIAGVAYAIGFVWFDGEESTLPGWNDGETSFPKKIVDNTWGSRHAAAQPFPRKLAAVVLLDMIGSPELRITRDAHSTPAMMRLLEAAVASLGYPESLLSPEYLPVEDDHIPFLKRGIPALNIIDFSDLSVWHTPGDDPFRVNPKSAEKAARIGLLVALAAAMDPQAIR